MRSTISSCSASHGPNALAIVRYERGHKGDVPTSTSHVDATDPCQNVRDTSIMTVLAVADDARQDPLNDTVPFFPIEPTSQPQTTQIVNVTGGVNATGHFVWYMNNSTFRADYNNPLLLLASQNNETYPLDPQWNVYDFGTSR